MGKKENDAKWREKNRERLKNEARKYKLRAKLTILDRYGKVCANCGFDDIRALHLDHIENNGAEERKSLGSQKFSGANFYLYLIKQGLPDGYQTLCANCNFIKQWDLNKRSQGEIEPPL